jgi:hypothetical protein
LHALGVGRLRVNRAGFAGRLQTRELAYADANEGSAFAKRPGRTRLLLPKGEKDGMRGAPAIRLKL